MEWYDCIGADVFIPSSPIFFTQTCHGSHSSHTMRGYFFGICADPVLLLVSGVGGHLLLCLVATGRQGERLCHQETMLLQHLMVLQQRQSSIAATSSMDNRRLVGGECYFTSTSWSSDEENMSLFCCCRRWP